LAKNFILEQLKLKFKEEKFFKRESLLNFYRQFDLDLKESTFRWRIYQLKAKKIITPVGLKYCIWSTKSVNEFMLHLPGSFITILQVEKDALEPVYDYLKSNNKGTVYFQPDEKEIDRYIFEAELPIILQSLISKAPTQKVGKIATITIEKMIVDLFCEKYLFVAYQGSELVHIINNAYERYTVNFTTLLHYARRRGKEVDIKHFLKEKTDIPKVIFNDKN